MSMFYQEKIENLPPPNQSELAQHEILLQHIQHVIEKSGGKITFARYMEMALYEAGLGYYVAGQRIFGKDGDFVTAPELTPLFSHCVAKQCAQVMGELERPVILEFGAGSGIMALEILRYLDSINGLPDEYLIMEISPALRQRQHQLIADNLPHLQNRVRWLSTLPDERFSGLILANEILDAMPVNRVRVYADGSEQEIYIGMEAGVLKPIPGGLSDQRLKTVADRVRKCLGEQMPEYFDVEANLLAEDWLTSLNKVLDRGLVLIIDYGYPRHEFFQPIRYQGTLMCHYKHHAHADPLFYPGLQDLTSSVEFTEIAEFSVAAGFDVDGFITQALFLIGCGIDELIQTLDPTDTKTFLATTQPVKQLLMPDQMGELFKVLALSKDLDLELIGYQAGDQLGRL